MWYTQSSFIKEGVEWETATRNETGYVTETVPLRIKASLVAQTVNNLPAMQETQVQSQDQEDPLEKGMATHSGILAWRIAWTEEPGGIQSMGSQRVGHD